MLAFRVLCLGLCLTAWSAPPAEPHEPPARDQLRSARPWPNALSGKQQIFLAQLCERPAETICSLNPTDTLAKEINEIRQEVESEALRALADARGERSVSAFEAADNLANALSLVSVPITVLKEMESPQVVSGTSFFLKKVEEIVSRELGDVRRIPDFLEGTIQKGFQDAIKSHSFASQDREKLVEMATKAIGQVKVYTPLEFLENGGSFLSVRTFCGRRLLSYNAFFFPENVPKDSTTRAVVLCPGVWLSAIAAKRSGNFSNNFLKDLLFSILSHETGHRIDYKRATSKFGAGTTPYETFASCVHSTLPGQTKLDEFKADDFNEIVADYWSAEVLAALFRNGDLDRSDLLRILLYSSAPYCHSEPEPDDPHPPGLLRITLKVRNPRLQSALACPVRPAVSCGLEGPTR